MRKCNSKTRVGKRLVPTCFKRVHKVLSVVAGFIPASRLGTNLNPLNIAGDKLPRYGEAINI